MIYEQVLTCPVCGGEGDRSRTLVGLIYYRCRVCNCEWLRNRMTDEMTDMYYRGTYRKLCPVNDADMRSQLRRAENQINLVGKYLPHGSSVLEIGCSAGMLLDKLCRLGYSRRVGVDPDNRTIKADGLEVYSDLSDVPPAPFDLIVLSHSLEHLNHPVDMLKRLKADYSRDGTRFLVEVPNSQTCIHAYRPHHPVAYTPRALEWLMRRVGLEPLAQTTYSASQYILGVYYILNIIDVMV